MFSMRVAIIIGAMLVSSYLATTQAGTINVTAGDTGIASWGPSAAAYGQTFTVLEGDSRLDSYTFEILSLNASFPFVSQVYGWTGAAISGPAVYTSEVVLSPTPSNRYTPYTFSPSLPVLPGHEYIALITNYVDGVSIGGPVDGSVGGQINATNAHPYTGGSFAFAAGKDLGTFFVRDDFDLVFRAEFSAAPTPEPSTCALLLAGLTLFLLDARRRKPFGRLLSASIT